MKINTIRFTILFVLLSINLNAQKQIEYANKKYELFIKTVQLYPSNNLANQEMQTPIVSLKSNSVLMLEFDVLLEDYLFLQAKIIHCNADWTPSRLSDFKFLSDFNSFDLNDFEYSINTKTLYIHYTFQVPATKVSGNYLLLIYQNSDEKDIILSRRFVVYENTVNISPFVEISSDISARNFNQQVEFTINYNGLNVSNPLTDFHVVIRQNQRWDNAIIGLKPTLIRQDQKYLEYHHFTMENNFNGGNEFRFFDLRTYSFRGQHVSFINTNTNPISAFLAFDENRSKQIYTQYRDLNGQYFIETREPQAGILEEDYIDVTFQLNSNHKSEGDVYVLGAFNDWKKKPEYKLNYDKTRKLYWKTISLKQGVYSYTYYVNDNPYYFEGSFHQTENEYDILIYFRDLGHFVDRVVGYKAFNSAR